MDHLQRTIEDPVGYQRELWAESDVRPSAGKRIGRAALLLLGLFLLFLLTWLAAIPVVSGFCGAAFLVGCLAFGVYALTVAAEVIRSRGEH